MNKLVLLLLCILTFPALAQVKGTFWDMDGVAKEATFVKQDQLSDCNQQFYAKLLGGKMMKYSPGIASAYTIDGDTFVSRSIEGQPVFLKRIYGGPLTLFSADEVVLHTLLIERTGSSPLNPLATNVQRSYNKNDTSIDTPIAILMWEDGDYILINPLKKADAVAELKRFFAGWPEPLPTIPASQKTISFDYLKDVTARCNVWFRKKNNIEDSKAGF